MLLSSFFKKHDMKPKCEIGLLSQASEHRRSQEFGFGAAQNRNVQSHCHMLKRSDYFESWDVFLSARDNNVLSQLLQSVNFFSAIISQNIVEFFKIILFYMWALLRIFA